MASIRLGARVLRCSAWRQVASATVAAGALFWLAALGLGVGEGFLFLVLAIACCGGAAAFVLDDPAAAAADATPTGRARQARWRALQVLAPSVLATGAVVLVARGGMWPEARGLVAMALGVVAVGAAVAASLRRAGRGEPGDAASVVVVVGVLGLLLSDPTRRWVHLLPSLPGEPVDRTVAAWCGIAAACALVGVLAMRDPAHR